MHNKQKCIEHSNIHVTRVQHAHLNEQTFLKKKLITDITRCLKCPCPDKSGWTTCPKFTYPEKKDLPVREV